MTTKQTKAEIQKIIALELKKHFGSMNYQQAQQVTAPAPEPAQTSSVVEKPQTWENIKSHLKKQECQVSFFRIAGVDMFAVEKGVFIPKGKNFGEELRALGLDSLTLGGFGYSSFKVYYLRSQIADQKKFVLVNILNQYRV
mgnify:FL=1